MPDERDTARDASFWAWVDKTYNPRQVEIIQSEDFDFTPVWEHYMTRIVGTQWDVGAGLQSQLQTRIDSGEITRTQAADLWNEEQALADSRARASASQRTDFALAATGQLEAPEDRTRRLAEQARLGGREKLWRDVAEAGGITRIGQERAREGGRRPTPFTEFGTAEEFRTGFDVPQTENAISWFRRRFPRLIEQFQAKPEKEQTAQTWQEFLERERPAIREERARLSFWERGERPGVLAPRITTVGF